jgi:hypothetical protein
MKMRANLVAFNRGKKMEYGVSHRKLGRRQNASYQKLSHSGKNWVTAYVPKAIAQTIAFSVNCTKANLVLAEKEVK